MFLDFQGVELLNDCEVSQTFLITSLVQNDKMKWIGSFLLGKQTITCQKNNSIVVADFTFLENSAKLFNLTGTRIAIRSLFCYS